MSFLLNVDVPMNRLPIVNWILMGIIACASILAWTVGDILTWSSYGFFLLHINVLHLLLNLLVLWVFGNAILSTRASRNRDARVEIDVLNRVE
jgi:hypothetical protein